ncbi:hypothetical protein WM46_08505 [Citrobacter freundii complex sp. CFNIH2]|nr:hypothetical protein WM46_08505 [Citrobacter freundii complex sp. CFNIH2]
MTSLSVGIVESNQPSGWFFLPVFPALSIFSAAKLDAHQFWYDQCTACVILTLEGHFHCRNLLLIKGYVYNV